MAKSLSQRIKSEVLQRYHSEHALARLTRNAYRRLLRPSVSQIRKKLLEKTTIREIKEISEILYRNQCTWSLQSGNVLGIYRDGGFLKNEDDIDIAVLAETWRVKIEQEIRQQGYQVTDSYGGFYAGSEGVYIRVQKKGLPIEFYPTFKDSWDGVAYRWYGGAHADRYYFEPELIEETRTVDFYGVQVQIPADTDRYLRAIYGDDYMVPNPNWDWRTQPKCRLDLPLTCLTQEDVDIYWGSVR